MTRSFTRDLSSLSLTQPNRERTGTEAWDCFRTKGMVVVYLCELLSQGWGKGCEARRGVHLWKGPTAETEMYVRLSI